MTLVRYCDECHSVAGIAHEQRCCAPFDVSAWTVADRRHMGECMLRKIESANDEALRRIFEAEPVFVCVQPAGDVIEGLEKNMILHAGPPVEWVRVCSPMRGAVCGIAVFEGWAANLNDGETATTVDQFSFHPNHHFGTVGP